MKLTQKRLKEILQYNPEDGSFRWKVHRQCIRAGSLAGGDHTSVSSDYLIYRRITVDGRQYYAHRLAWLYIYGVYPTEDIDHINGNASDNRISNLRLATVSQNMANMRKRKPTPTGVKGVALIRNGNYIRYRARVRVNGELKHLGYFKNIFDAENAALKGRRLAFGEYAR